MLRLALVTQSTATYKLNYGKALEISNLFLGAADPGKVVLATVAATNVTSVLTNDPFHNGSTTIGGVLVSPTGTVVATFSPVLVPVGPYGSALRGGQTEELILSSQPIPSNLAGQTITAWVGEQSMLPPVGTPFGGLPNMLSAYANVAAAPSSGGSGSSGGGGSGSTPPTTPPPGTNTGQSQPAPKLSTTDYVLLFGGGGLLLGGAAWAAWGRPR